MHQGTIFFHFDYYYLNLKCGPSQGKKLVHVLDTKATVGMKVVALQRGTFGQKTGDANRQYQHFERGGLWRVQRGSTVYNCIPSIISKTLAGYGPGFVHYCTECNWRHRNQYGALKKCNNCFYRGNFRSLEQLTVLSFTG